MQRDIHQGVLSGQPSHFCSKAVLADEIFKFWIKHTYEVSVYILTVKVSSHPGGDSKADLGV